MTHNIALVVLDTTRALDTVPADRHLTPTLASVADRGTEFTRAFSAAPWTLPSHASLFTGTYPSKHGAHGKHPSLDGEHMTLAETLRTQGYQTVSVSNNAWVTEEFGLGRGFDTIREFGDAGDGRHPEEIPMAGRPTEDDDGAARTVAWIRNWLDRRDDDPFFLFANFIEPHLEYRPPRPYAEAFLPTEWNYAAAMDIPQNPRAFDAGVFDLSADEFEALRGLYRAEIAYLDSQLGDLVAALEVAGEREDTVLIIVGDHGENVGEHGLLGHQYRLTDTLLHVPLIIDGGPFAGGGPVEDLVQVLDLAPTVLELGGVDRSAKVDGEHQGNSLHPDASSDPREAIFAEHIAPQPGVDVLEEQFGTLPEELYEYERSLRAIRTNRYKYVRGSDGTERLFDLVDDPGETTDRATAERDVATALEDRLESWLSSFEHADTGGTVSIDDATEQRLSDLGYL